MKKYTVNFVNNQKLFKIHFKKEKVKNEKKQQKELTPYQPSLLVF